MYTIEQEIQAKGLTAPRVTPTDIEAEIASEHYFTAGAAADYAPGAVNTVTIPGELPTALHQLTFCVLALRNGFTVTGESACASPENFDAEIGRKVARANAVEKLWPLLGFRLRDKLARVPCVIHRDAATGQMVSEEYAAANPATTVRETR